MGLMNKILTKTISFYTVFSLKMDRVSRFKSVQCPVFATQEF